MRKWTLCVAVGLIIGFPLPAGHPSLCTAQEAPLKPGAGDGDSTAPVACVRTAPLRTGTITEQILVYGAVIAAPGALRTVSIPFESQVLGVMVSEGQKVAEGDMLLKIQPSPDTILKLDQARNAYDLAQQSHQQMESKRSLKLATNEQVLQTKQVLDQAKLNLESMKKRGVNGETRIASSVGGLVKKVYVQEGSIVPAGNPVIDIVAQNRVEVLLGVEPEDIERVQAGQAVTLTRVYAQASPDVTGKVRKISYAVNPATRLVDVFVSLASPTGFLLGESIEGKILTAASEGLIVPRSAVLPEGNRYVVFTVRDGRAVKHTVDIGIENAGEYQVLGEDLKAGEEIVVLGNYELTNGMAVRTGTCP